MPDPRRTSTQYARRELDIWKEELDPEWAQTKPHFMTCDFLNLRDPRTPCTDRKQRVWKDELELERAQTRSHLERPDVPGLRVAWAASEDQEQRIWKEEIDPDWCQTRPTFLKHAFGDLSVPLDQGGDEWKVWKEEEDAEWSQTKTELFAHKTLELGSPFPQYQSQETCVLKAGQDSEQYPEPNVPLIYTKPPVGRLKV
ncbi:uncharacterized protein EI97DRAFT_483126 [Westerdykella ornata]|uniref:Uncharacterized protein n=1 Tax=Westerdykella ornata TaxID=318751 RepID=A0A6A6JBE3_WESOR|nr:uncharacterized protein EI97DRAFT_483126 [Westerdykella ornata]KAF2272956.1 hypothetical protein EI97DRAFT_483126 [Westerdykella ornata]